MIANPISFNHSPINELVQVCNYSGWDETEKIKLPKYIPSTNTAILFRKTSTCWFKIHHSFQK